MGGGVCAHPARMKIGSASKAYVRNDVTTSLPYAPALAIACASSMNRTPPRALSICLATTSLVWPTNWPVRFWPVVSTKLRVRMTPLR